MTFAWARRVREFFLLADFKSSVAIAVVGVLLVIQLFLLFYWDSEPELFDVEQVAMDQARQHGHQLVTGYVTTVTLQQVAATMLDKRGGYLSNDVAPPSVMMDNIPNWEWGVLRQVRDLARALRFDISRSQSQSTEDPNLAVAEPRFIIDSQKWMFPRAETEYRKGIESLQAYLDRLADPTQPDAQFYARADNLADWLASVQKQLGSLSSRLGASVGRRRFNTDLSGDPVARQSTYTPSELSVKTPWLEIDDTFFEARGACWALIHFLRAAEIDFADVLEKKNARASVQQIIRDLEATQSTVWSPMILNGTGFGFTANHSLVIASYIAQANAAIIDLRHLLSDG
jgi:hypothetical protein